MKALTLVPLFILVWYVLVIIMSQNVKKKQVLKIRTLNLITDCRGKVGKHPLVVISTGVGNFPCLSTFSMIPN